MEDAVMERPWARILDQYKDRGDALAQSDTTAEQILEQTGGDFTLLVTTAGMGGTLTGISRKIKEKAPHVTFVGVGAVGSLLAVDDSVDDQNGLQPFQVEGVGCDFGVLPLRGGSVAPRRPHDRWLLWQAPAGRRRRHRSPGTWRIFQDSLALCRHRLGLYVSMGATKPATSLFREEVYAIARKVHTTPYDPVEEPAVKCPVYEGLTPSSRRTSRPVRSLPLPRLRGSSGQQNWR